MFHPVGLISGAGATTSLSAFVNGLGDEASLTDNLATPVKLAATVFNDCHLPSPVTASAAQDATAAEIHRSRVTLSTAGA